MSTDSRDNNNGESPDGGDRDSTEPDESLDELELGEKEYLGYWVLRIREETGGQPISRSVFWKLCCLTDRHLIREYSLDISFPRHWYKYGEVGEAHSLTRDFFKAPKARFWQGQEYHSKEIPETAFEVDNERKTVIRQAALETVREYQDKSAQGLKEIQYNEFAPNDFIESYSKLREHLEKLDSITEDNDNTRQVDLHDFIENEERDHIEKLLDKMVTTYPREKYPDVYRLYLRWDDTMRMLVEQNRSIHEQKVFLELFVEKLSEITLRFEHNHAIPEERLESWQEARDDKIEQLNEGIEETRKECLSRREQSGELESIAHIYDEVIMEKI
ncbi:hypothetical protein Harman_11660 [Haloarcula mannanilytica]|uniref:Uncharacterized protein n=1 Tax=Haloarcula mannanilytica TaxID=2509225 RepID=A0A4C2EFE4_9EURY|nr:hypothetical protein [Haloarcula mannanilytica]GCF13231.1 hypothetical protein Harman_11660 [Haloarcula mannanilytica]